MPQVNWALFLSHYRHPLNENCAWSRLRKGAIQRKIYRYHPMNLPFAGNRDLESGLGACVLISALSVSEISLDLVRRKKPLPWAEIL